jgi:hypothetical protein
MRDEPYFQRLARGFHGGSTRVRVVPYSYRVGAPSLEGVQGLVARAFGGSASLICAPSVEYGEEDALPAGALPDGTGPVLALFNLAATPEREAHVAFVETLKAKAGSQPVIVLVDEAPFRARNGAERLEERRSAWRDVLAERGLDPVFADLERADLARLESDVEARL